MKSPALLIAAALFFAPAAFADDDQCSASIDQLDEAMDQRELTDTLEDQVDQLKDQAEQYKDDDNTAECVSTVDQAMQLLNSAPLKN